MKKRENKIKGVLSVEEQKSLINLDIKNTKKIKDMDVEVQRVVIGKDINMFKQINNPHEDIIKYIAKMKPSLLKDEMYEIESVQYILIQKSPEYFKMMKKPSNYVRRYMAVKYPNLMSYGRDDKELKDLAFKNNLTSVKKFEDKFNFINEQDKDVKSGLFVYCDKDDVAKLDLDIMEVPSGFIGYLSSIEVDDFFRLLKDKNVFNIVSLDKVKNIDFSNIDSIKLMSGRLRCSFERIPYKLIKHVISEKTFDVGNIKFDGEDDILDLIKRCPEALRYVVDTTNITENIMSKIDKKYYDFIQFIDNISVETQRKMLEDDIRNAGKIKNLDMDLAKEFAVKDKSIFKYMRYIDEEIMAYCISEGINLGEMISKKELANNVLSLFINNSILEKQNDEVLDNEEDGGLCYVF